MLPRKIFENLHAAMAILLLYFLSKFSGKFGLKFLTPILSASPNMMHFVLAFSIYEKLYTSKTNCIYQRGSK